MKIQIDACDQCERPRGNLLSMEIALGGQSGKALLCEECAQPFVALAGKLLTRRRRKPPRPRRVVLSE